MLFSFGEADMGGVQMQTNAPSFLQSSVGITPRGRIQNWSKVVDEIFFFFCFYDHVCHN